MPPPCSPLPSGLCRLEGAGKIASFNAAQNDRNTYLRAWLHGLDLIKSIKESRLKQK